jgi:hypothetical protein
VGDDGVPVSIVAQFANSMVVKDGLLQSPLLHDAAGMRAAYWNQDINIVGDTKRIGATFKMSPNTGDLFASVTFVFWATPRVMGPGMKVPNASVHLSVSANTWEYSIWENGVTEVLSRGTYSGGPLKTDWNPSVAGSGTLYRSEVLVVGDTAYILLPDGSAHSVTDPRIGAIPANIACHELYRTKDTSAYYAFQDVWADSRVSSPGGTSSGEIARALSIPKADTAFRVIKNVSNNMNVLLIDSTSKSTATTNYLMVQSTDANPVVYGYGAAADITVTVGPKGAGTFGIRVDAGQTPTVEARGADANLNLRLLAKGTGKVLANGLEVAVEVDRLAVGEATIPRRMVSSSAVVLTNGAMRLAYFTAEHTEVITSIRVPSGAVAGVGATLARIGVYRVEANGDLTLVCSTVNDPALWSAKSTEYVRPLTTLGGATFTKNRGTRYAVGCLVVGSTTAPQVCGVNALDTAEYAHPPRLAGLVQGLTDLPAKVSASGAVNPHVIDAGPHQYAVLVP